MSQWPTARGCLAHPMEVTVAAGEWGSTSDWRPALSLQTMDALWAWVSRWRFSDKDQIRVLPGTRTEVRGLDRCCWCRWQRVVAVAEGMRGDQTTHALWMLYQQVGCEVDEMEDSQYTARARRAPQLDPEAWLTDALHKRQSLNDCTDFCGSPQSQFPWVFKLDDANYRRFNTTTE